MVSCGGALCDALCKLVVAVDEVGTHFPSPLCPVAPCLLRCRCHQSTKYEELNAPPVIPEGFPQWTDVLNTWGSKMIATLNVRES